MKQNEYKEKEDNKSKMTKRILIILGIVIIILLLLLLLRGCNNTDTKVPVGTSSTTGIDFDDGATEGTDLGNMTKEEIQAYLNEKVAKTSINVSMSTTPKFKNGKAKGELNIVNNKVNNYPQSIKIYITDTQEVIYQTKAIAIGSKIKEDNLDVALKKGVYECTAEFSSLDPETGNTVGKANVSITVTVEN